MGALAALRATPPMRAAANAVEPLLAEQNDEKGQILERVKGIEPSS
jgi:hypothetical protein